MSQPVIQQRLSITDIRSRKGKAPIVVLTAYTAPFARILDPHVDILLVGDSLGMVLYGMKSTLPVTLEMMIAHGKSVVDASSKACVIVDLPFASYQQSREQAFASAARVIAETGAAGVKLEGGAEMAETVRFLSERGIPVMAHVGLMPQHVNTMGGYRYQGRTDEECDKIIADAKAVTHAGAFSLLIEGVAEELGAELTRIVEVPTIGIGASSACDGQVLVTEDMAGLLEKTPRFVQQYGNLADMLENAAKAYASDVRARKFPGPEHLFGTNKK